MSTISSHDSQALQGQSAGEKNAETISLGKGIGLLLICVILFVVIGIGIGEAFFWHRYSTASQAEHLLQTNLQAVQTDPNNPVYHISLGMSYANLGKADQAVGEYKKALSLDPSSYGAIYNLGHEYLLLKNYDDAIPQLKQATKLVPTNTMPHLDLAICYYNTDQFDNANAELALASKYNPGTPDVAYWQGMVYEKQNKLQDAYDQFKSAVGLNPDYAQAKAELDKLTKQGYK